MRPFSLNDWTVEPDRLLIVRGGQSVRLEPKGMALLCSLASRPGAVVTKEELLATVWNDVVVGDDVLTTAMHQLRRALGDDHRTPRYIETIPRRGYRLVARMQPLRPRPASRRVRTAIAAAALLAIAATGSILERRSDRAAALELRRLASENLGRGVELPETARLLRRAVELDPSVGAARGSLALALVLTDGTPAAEVRREIDRALRLDPANRHARIAAGLDALWEDWDWVKARIELESVAREGDPIARAWLAYVHALAGRRDAAAVELESIDGPPIAVVAASMTHLLLGDSARADAVLSTALRADPENDALIRQRSKIHERRMEATGHAAGPAAAGRVGLTTLARLHLAHGETEQALAALERASREREHEILYLRVDRRWDALRNEPRFRRIIAAVGPEGVPQ